MSGTARVFRWLGITLGALVILALGAYGPATLLGPLPAITATALNPTLGGSDFDPPKLPEAGASAVALGSSTELLGSAGVTEAVPMGSIAKVVTALVVLDKHPISEGDSGESVTITKAQVRAYNNYTKQGVRTVQVKAGEIWTEQQLIEAMIMGSSNNHADLLAIWAFGSTKKYLDAANAWLAENGMNDTYVDDATGISAASVGTADDLARLAVLAYDAPAIAAFAGESSVTVGGGRTVYNVSEFMTDSGVTPLALSYTDAAGLTLLYQAEVPVDDTTANLRGVMLWMPDWDTLESSMNSLLKSAEGSITQTTLVSEGDAFGEWTSPWGESAKAVANADVSELVWQSGAPEYLIYLDDPEPSLRGTEVGSVVIETEAGPQEIGLVLDASVSDPGLGWRLTHPFDTIPS